MFELLKASILKLLRKSIVMLAQSTYQDCPFFQFVGYDSAPLWNPIVEDSGNAQHQPTDVKPTGCRIQLMDSRIPHPHRHKLTSNEDWNNDSPHMLDINKTAQPLEMTEQNTKKA